MASDFFDKMKPEIRDAYNKMLEHSRAHPEKTIVVGVPIVKMAKPYFPSVQRTCNTCNALCWLDKNLTDIADKASGFLCTNCVAKSENRPIEAVAMDSLNSVSDQEI